MATNNRAIDELERQWDALVAGDSLANTATDETIAADLRRLVALTEAPAPDPAFADRLRQQLFASGVGMNGRKHGLPLPSQAAQPRRSPWAVRSALLAAAVVVLAVVGLTVWGIRPDPVSAAMIVQQAQAAVASPVSAGIQSFVAVETASLPLDPGRPAAGQVQVETRRWFAAPNRWRIETSRQTTGPDGQVIDRQVIVAWLGDDADVTTGPDGQVIDRQVSVVVSDGTDVWMYDQAGQSAAVSSYEPTLAAQVGLSPFGNQAGDLQQLFEQASTCYAPTLRGTATVAGRPAHEIDLGPSLCPSASVPNREGRQVIWVDQETFFVLKRVFFDDADGQPLVTTEVTSIEYNVAIDPARFVFSPPAGVEVQDLRPKPALTAAELEQQLAQIAPQVDFPIFVPRDLPAGLVPLAPRRQQGDALELRYVPVEAAGQVATAGPDGLTIVQQRASYGTVVRWTEQTEPIRIAGGEGWLRRGGRDAAGGGSSSAAIILRDGVLISVSSLTVSPEVLVQVAASLEPVPGGHAPLPRPTPPTLASVRQEVGFPVFVPTDVPPGLTPEPPLSDGQPEGTVEIRYHRADGSIGLQVVNGPAGCCLAADPRRAGTAVPLPGGLTAHLLGGGQSGDSLLWWEQDGTYLALSGPGLSEATLIQIAGSMSSTAELGPTELPIAQPTPSPVPAPAFRILRPSWLPEAMTVREQYEPTSHGSGIILGFDPRPEDAPHDVLTLREIPAAAASLGAADDPQATRETIGGRDVTIIRRGNGCVSAEWVQDGVALTLTNPYDPPGEPGEVRYTCDQLRRIIESIE